jgi:hypothetical protein
MKKVKLLLTGTVILLGVGGAFASKSRTANVYTKLDDVFPGQYDECQFRGTCTGSGALCRTVVFGVAYQLYYSGCSTPANGIFAL